MEQLNNVNLPLYTISTAANILGISIHTLRMYEREGLIVPHKKNSGHRLYSQSDLDRIQCIRNAIKNSKISIAGIKMLYSLIPCWQILNCPMEERKLCPSFLENTQPCWTFNHETNVCNSNECRKCQVYKDFGDCGKIKSAITQLN